LPNLISRWYIVDIVISSNKVQITSIGITMELKMNEYNIPHTPKFGLLKPIISPFEYERYT
jgi:hypothetical protein